MRDDRIFRTVAPAAVADYEMVRDTGLLQELAAAGKVVTSDEVDPEILGETGRAAGYVLEHPRLPFISYPYEWTFAALKAAARLQLELNLTALNRNVMLSDASAYNIQFHGAEPIFIDTLSFRPYRQGEFWQGHRQFCEQFLNPLLLRALLGVPHNAWYRGTQEGIGSADLARLLPWRRRLSRHLLTHVFLQVHFQRSAGKSGRNLDADTVAKASLPKDALVRMLSRLRGWIAGLEPKGAEKTVWRGYAESTSYSSDETKAKEAFVAAFAGEHRPRLIWDIGCNIGRYSEIALDAGAGHAIGFDSDHGALEHAFELSRAEGRKFQPLFMDTTNPSPDQGWAQAERRSLQARADADGVLALALVHHLAIGRNVPLPAVIDWITGLAPRGIIEFVPKADPMVQELLRLREDIFPSYTEELFVEALAERTQLVRQQRVSESGRTLFEFAR